MNIGDRLSEAYASDFLNLIIMPTEQCNFRCTYCYEDFEVGKMPTEVLAGLLNLIRIRAPDLSRLSVSWFGGEPLLAFDIIREIMEFSWLQVARNPLLAIDGNITTNGYFLTPDRIEYLCDRGVRTFQISLDGPEDVHNLSRVARGGQGTFRRIWGNLLSAKMVPAEFDAILRIHFTPGGWQLLFPLIDQIATAFGGDPRYRVHFKAIEKLGGERDAEIQTFSVAQKKEVKASLLERLGDTVKTLDDESDAEVCYASTWNSFIVRANGTIAKCTVALRDPNNRIGSLNPDGSMALNAEKLRLWTKGLETREPFDLACPWNAFVSKRRSELRLI